MQGFEYRGVSGSGDAIIPVKDFPLNATYAATAKKGDIVKLNSSAEVVLGAAADTVVLGVLEAASYDGIGVLPKTAQVRTGRQAIYEVTYTAGTKTSLASSDIGTAFDITSGGNSINLDDTTGGFCKVLKYNSTKKTAHIQLTNTMFM